jgi:hypothetical protein
VRGDAPAGPPGPSGIRRAPPREPARDGERPLRRDDRGRRGDERRPRDDRSRPRQEDRGARPFEPPVPQDPRSIELGAAFREAQTALRDARKALEKRREDFGDEPEWLVEQLAAAEAGFAEASNAWVEHLETTGRKMARNR